MRNFIFIAILVILSSCANRTTIQIQTPDNKATIYFGINESKEMYYSILYEDSVILRQSLMGFQIENEPGFMKNVKIVSYSEMTVNQTWTPVYGERNVVSDKYNQVAIHLKQENEPHREFEVTFRAYNEGIAFNYTLLPNTENEALTVQKEKTEFNFKKDYLCWASEWAQSEIHKIPISLIKKPVERPLVIETETHTIELGEAQLVDFARMKFINSGKEHSLVANLDGEAKLKLPYTTPWRTIMIAKNPAELLANNFFYENLNAPCAINDVSWIKPGKVIREVTLTTKGGLACVDFAVENGLQCVEFDAGWYGPEGDENSDATTITVDPKRSSGPLDLHKVINYANSKGIGIIVYVNRRALEKQLDTILPLYHSWGIKGVKYGFVQVGSQEWTTWLHKAVRKAAENQLMVDIHDEYRPTGFSRTYPNLLTQEGIRGDEESPTNEHTLKTLFTRMLAGAGDNTICYYAPRVNEKMGGHVSQLAKAVMLYSPWQFLYWYDRPQGSPGKKGGAGNSDGFIQNDPELQFYKELPTVWDNSKIIEGKIGEYATIARKSGSKWFVGSLTGKEPHSLKLNFSFLDTDKNYEATVYSYDPQSPSSTNVKIEKQNVSSTTILDFNIQANSGLALQINPD